MVNKQRQIEINTEKNKKKKRSTTTLPRRKEMKKKVQYKVLIKQMVSENDKREVE